MEQISVPYKEGGRVIYTRNPTARSIGVPLFFEFWKMMDDAVKVVFKEDYLVGGRISIPYKKNVVTGILLFDESGKWILFSPWTWTSEGKPLM